MKRSYERLHYTNRLKILSAGALLAQTIFHARLTAAYWNKKIPTSQYRQWKHLLEEMYADITNAPVNNRIECAVQECRVKQLMDAALHIKFDHREPWQGYQPLTDNRLFPMPRHRSSLRRFQPYLINRSAKKPQHPLTNSPFSKCRR